MQNPFKVIIKAIVVILIHDIIVLASNSNIININDVIIYQMILIIIICSTSSSDCNVCMSPDRSVDVILYNVFLHYGADSMTFFEMQSFKSQSHRYFSQIPT